MTKATFSLVVFVAFLDTLTNWLQVSVRLIGRFALEAQQVVKTNGM